MKIFVTGANGQLGCSLRKISGEFPDFNFVFTDLPEADITDRTGMESLIERHAPGLLVNCAAYTAVDRAESEPDLCTRINVEGPRILAEIARNRNIPLIHISTDYVFDGRSCAPLHEDHPVSPSGIYGKTKLWGEAAVEVSGCRAVVVRTSWLYSEYGANFLKTMLRLGKERNELKVVYDQVGSPTYAPDLARTILLLARKGIEGYRTYHFSNEGVCSWYDFAHAIFERSDVRVNLLPIESDQYPTPARRPAYSVLSKEKIKGEGIPVPYWTDSLRRCLAELSKNGKAL